MTYPQQQACPLTTASTMRKGNMQTRTIRMTRLRTLVTRHSLLESHTIEPSPVCRIRELETCRSTYLSEFETSIVIF